MRKSTKLTLSDRIEIACEEGLWRTYSECYTDEDLDGFGVPKTVEDLDEAQRKIYESIKERKLR